MPPNTPVGSNVDDDDGTPFAIPEDFPSSGAAGAISVTTTFTQTLALVDSFLFVVVIDVDNVIGDDDDEPSGGLRKSFTRRRGLDDTIAGLHNKYPLLIQEMTSPYALGHLIPCSSASL